MLSQADHARVEDAVHAAEAQTSGEIVCIVAREVSNYREVPLAYAAAAALLLPPLAVLLGLHPGLFTPGAADWTTGGATASDAGQTLARVLGGYALAQCALFAVVAGLVAIPVVRRTLTPGSLKRHRVHQAALQQFLATGLHANPARTGVVIYASQHDRRVELLADDAIHEAVGDRAWTAAVKAVQAGMRKGDAASGLISAVEICGAALAEHFPASRAPHTERGEHLVEL